MAPNSFQEMVIPSRRLPIFDGLRGMAAIMVMLYHAELSFGIPTLFSRGYLFVDLFFMLSGFVLTLSVDRECMGSADFLWRRVKRLWPLATVGTFLGAAAALLMGEHEGVGLSLTLALLMIPSLSGTRRLFPLNGPQWSLLLELMANLLHALILRRLTDGQLRVVVLVSALALATTIMLFGGNILGGFAANWHWVLPRVAFSYILGIWFARQWVAGVHAPLLSWKLSLTLPVLCVIVLPGIPLDRPLGDMLVTIVVLPILFWMAALAPVPRGAEVWLGRLGALSFPLYAIHLPVFEAVAFIDSSASSMLLAIIGAIVAAFLIDLFKIALSRNARAGRARLFPRRTLPDEGWTSPSRQ